MASDNEESFDLHVVGDATGKTWSGKFAAKKRLSHRDYLRHDALRREYLGSSPGVPSSRAITTAMVLADLAVRLTKWEKWWETTSGGLDLEDDNVVSELQKLCLKVEDDAAEAKKKSAEAAQAKLRTEHEAEKAADVD